MEATPGNSIFDFETLFSDFQEWLNGSGLITHDLFKERKETNSADGRESDLYVRRPSFDPLGHPFQAIYFSQNQSSFQNYYC